MKVPAWALAIFVLGLFGIIMINLFGNITVTDQLNYTTMKNAVEASMYDSIDKGYYSVGFCLCTNNSKTSGKWVFNDDSEYDLVDITYKDGKESCVSSKKNCEIMRSEYRINKKTFSESLIRRFAEMVNNNKDYEILIQDIIEYPPKVSVRINSKDKEFSPTEKNTSGYTIVNQMDAIIETKKVVNKAAQANANTTIVNPTQSSISNVSSTPLTAPTTEPTPTPVKKCYYKGEPDWKYCWGTSDSCGAGYKEETSVTKESDCQNVCFCQTNGNNCGTWAKKNWDGYEMVTPVNGKCQRETTCYYDRETYKYCWGTKIDCGIDYIWKDEKGNVPSKSECVNECYCGSTDSNHDTCGIWAKWDWENYERVDLTSTGECKRASSTVNDSCSWHASVGSAYCTIDGGKTSSVSCSVSATYTLKPSDNAASEALLKKAKNGCTCKTVSGGTASITGIGLVSIYRKYKVYYSDSGQTACAEKRAQTGAEAIATCSACNNKTCSATCS